MAFMGAVGSWLAANAGTIAAVTAAAGGVASGISSRNAAVAQSNQAKAQAAREGDAARQREIERKRNLLRALSQQSAAIGASGVTAEGSLAGIARADIRDASTDLLVDRSNTESTINSLQSGAAAARQAGNLGLAASLFDTAQGVAATYAPKKKTK
jgi:hypothetical protein